MVLRAPFGGEDIKTIADFAPTEAGARATGEDIDGGNLLERMYGFKMSIDLILKLREKLEAQLIEEDKRLAEQREARRRAREAAAALVERFDIEPYSDFSAK